MNTPLKIDFVSDVSCPWCAIGLHSLEQAIQRLGDDIAVELHFQPFELNPQLPAAGADIVAHLAAKYGRSREQFESRQETIRSRGEQVGFKFDIAKRTHIYNTFAAHRLLHWAGRHGKQLALKHALLTAYFSDGKNVSDPAVLVDIATQVGLDPVRTQEILASDEYAAEVREREHFYQASGIQGVPAVIVNDRHLIQGGQPAEVFEQTLRQLAAEKAAGPTQ